MLSVLSYVFFFLSFLFENGLSTSYIAVTSQGNVRGDNAQSYCQSTYGTSLATITSAEENALVLATAVAAGITDDSFWIGATDVSVEGTFVWLDGTGNIDDIYSNWDDGEPNNGNSIEDCSIMLTDGTWNDLSCSHSRSDWQKQFVCNYPRIVYVSLTLNWRDAETYCNNNFGTSLVRITNEDTNVAAWSAITTTNTMAHIGLYDINNSTTGDYNWSWVDTLNTYADTLNNYNISNVSISLLIGTGYTNWNTNQPNNNEQGCASFSNASDGTWNNIDCSDQTQGFICNEPDPTVSPTNVPSAPPTAYPSPQPFVPPTNSPSVMPTTGRL